MSDTGMDTPETPEMPTDKIKRVPMHGLEESRELSQEIARLAEDRNCSNIVILELAAISPVAKHFVIATGTSAQQLRSVGSEIAVLGKERGFDPFGKAGIQQGRWIIVDFVDVVVHLFDEEYRDFYDLEMLWGDSPRVQWQDNDDA